MTSWKKNLWRWLKVNLNELDYQLRELLWQTTYSPASCGLPKSPQDSHELQQVKPFGWVSPSSIPWLNTSNPYWMQVNESWSLRDFDLKSRQSRKHSGMPTSIVESMWAWDRSQEVTLRMIVVKQSKHLSMEHRKYSSAHWPLHRSP